MESEYRPAARLIVGRERELEAIERLISMVRDGLGAVLVLRGEAGLGKTALLEHAIASARDELDVAHVLGVKSEMALGFAALHQLLAPFLGGLDALPAPQADALRGAFGLGGDREVDRFLVGLATLTLLADAATSRGLLVVVDDAQWLDRESADAIAFVSRRLLADRLGILWAVRDPNDADLALDALPAISLVGLSEQRAGELLAMVAGGPVDARVRARLLEQSHGSPLALVELSRALSRDQLAGLTAVSEPLPVSQSLEARFLQQVRSLPDDTQLLLLVAAADPTGDPILLWRAGEVLGFGVGAGAPAEVADLISLGSGVTFRHPLVREAIYQGAPDDARRRVHEALATATDPERDPDRRAWHRAAAAAAPDESVADELERAAHRAQHRGGYASTAALLARAAELTPDTSRRAARELAAAGASLNAGNLALARAQLAHAQPDLADEFSRAQARHLDGTVSWIGRAARGEVGSAREEKSVDAAALLMEASAALRVFDAHAARNAFADAINAAVYFGGWSSASVHDVARSVQRAVEPGTRVPAPGDLVHDAIVDLYTNGHASAAPLLRESLDAARTDTAVQAEWHMTMMTAWVAFAIGDYVALRALLTDSVAIARARGALTHLSPAYYYLGECELAVGSIAGAESYFAQQHDLLAARGLGFRSDPSALVIPAWRGRETEVRTESAELATELERRGLGWPLARVARARTILELGLGNYAAAAGSLPAAGWTDDLAFSVFNASDAIEALVRAGNPDEAGETLDWLSARATANNTPLELGLLHRSRALFGDELSAEDDYQAAIALLDGHAGPHHLGRAHLLYGEWLRRQRRRADARKQLALAFELLSTSGAEAFAQRARVELLATGATARKRVDETRTDLTPQEARIAQLAAGGATNAEIAAALFISPYTVEYHLRKVFTKLGITSRRQLSRALPS